MYKIDLITSARSDFTLWLPVYRAIRSDKRFSCRFIVTGTHFLSSLGNTYKEVHKEIPIEDRYDIPIGDKDNLEACLSTILNQYYLELLKGNTDLVFILGDRFELLPVMTAAVINRVPMAQLFGGECDVSYCIDTQIRNSITKASHIFFVTHNDIKQRMVAMGEEEWRICVSGNSSDHIKPQRDKSIYDFLKSIGINIGMKEVVNCCYHPPTIRPNIWQRELPEIFAALEEFPDFFYIWTGVNADPEGNSVREFIKSTVKEKSNHVFVDHLGGNLYRSLLSNARLMVGNSSSGLLEAPIYQIPVINVGSRQAGRLHGPGVIDCAGNKASISSAIIYSMKMSRVNIINVFAQPNFPYNISEHLYCCLQNPDLMIKRLTGVQNTLQRVPEYE